MSAKRFEAAIAAMDAANRADPKGKELEYARRMTDWLEKLAPDAPETVRLAARAQHLRRWEIPRSSFPEGRIGYLSWRTTLYQFHAEQAGTILRQVGYEEPTVAAVQGLLKKQKLKIDPDAQLLEDVVCLVFLQYEFADFLEQHAHEEEKVIDIVRKTWKKMSARGHGAALELAPHLPAAAQAIISRALGG